MGEGEGSLSVHVLSASGLMVGDSEKSTSDPYVILTLSSPHKPPTPSAARSLETKVIRSSLEPRWDQLLRFVKVSQGELATGTLSLEVFDDAAGTRGVGEGRAGEGRWRRTEGGRDRSEGCGGREE